MNTDTAGAVPAIECDHYWELEHGVDESGIEDGFRAVPYVQERCSECGETRALEQDFSPDDDDMGFDRVPMRDGPALRVDP